MLRGRSPMPKAKKKMLTTKKRVLVQLLVLFGIQSTFWFLLQRKKKRRCRQSEGVKKNFNLKSLFAGKMYRTFFFLFLNVKIIGFISLCHLGIDLLTKTSSKVTAISCEVTPPTQLWRTTAWSKFSTGSPSIARCRPWFSSCPFSRHSIKSWTIRGPKLKLLSKYGLLSFYFDLKYILFFWHLIPRPGSLYNFFFQLFFLLCN